MDSSIYSTNSSIEAAILLSTNLLENYAGRALPTPSMVMRIAV